MLFDPSARFAWLESAAGPGSAEIVRVLAEGQSAACGRCSWRVLATDEACENCGAARSTPSTATVAITLPNARFECSDALAVHDDDALAVRLAARREIERAPCTALEWPGRAVVRRTPKSFRRLAAEWIARATPAQARIDVVCAPIAIGRWQQALAAIDGNVRIVSPRAIDDGDLDGGDVLIVDARAAFDPRSATHRRVARAPHRFVLARAAERTFADPDRVFAFTDVVAPATFASVHEARALHRNDRAAFLARRDRVVVSDWLPPTNAMRANEHNDSPSRVTVVAIDRFGIAEARALATITESAAGLSISSGRAGWDALRHGRRLDPTTAHFATSALEPLFASAVAADARVLTRSLVRLAQGYADRIDLAPRALRASLAAAFASRSRAMIERGTFRILVSPLASFTLAEASAR